MLCMRTFTYSELIDTNRGGPKQLRKSPIKICQHNIEHFNLITDCYKKESPSETDFSLSLDFVVAFFLLSPCEMKNDNSFFVLRSS